MSDDLNVRPACFADIPAMHAIRLSVRQNRLSDPSRISEQDYAPFVDQRSAWVAERSGTLIGFAAIDRARTRVWALFVDPTAEGSGVGRALHQRLLDWALEEGLSRLTLTTSPGTRAQRFYCENGWIEVGQDQDGEIVFERAP